MITFFLSVSSMFTLSSAPFNQSSLAAGGVCNYAVARKNVLIREEPSVRSKAITSIRKGSPLHVCDDNGYWYKVYFGGSCVRIRQGISFDRAQRCKHGWIKMSVVDIISG